MILSGDQRPFVAGDVGREQCMVKGDFLAEECTQGDEVKVLVRGRTLYSTSSNIESRNQAQSSSAIANLRKYTKGNRFLAD